MPLLNKDKSTKIEKEIINIFLNVKEPIYANYFIGKVKSHRATIFRILNKLVDSGVVKKVNFEEGRSRYEIAQDHHHHLVCQMCHKIIKLEECGIESLSAAIKRRTGFLVSRHNLEFFGFCNSCSLNK
jgi:Fur family transcriptional regulator, ferric uptake regulator